MAAHVDPRPARSNHNVTWGRDTVHVISPRDELASLPTSPQQSAAQYPDTQRQVVSGYPPAGAADQQWRAQQEQHTLPALRQYGHPAYPANYINPYASAHAGQYATFGASQPGVAPGAVGGLVGIVDRSDASHGYPAPSAGSPFSCNAPLMGNLSLPSTPSETPLARSPQHSPPRTPPESPRAQSASSWGTPSPEPDAQAGLDSDVSPHLQEFMLKWDVRGDRLESISTPRWFSEPAFRSGRSSCELVFKADSERWSVQVPERKRGRALAIRDVLYAIDEELWNKADSHTFYEGHPRLEKAYKERSYRHLGVQDGNVNTLRNVDFFPEDESDFVGLKEDVGRPGAFLVVIGSAPSH